MQPEPGLTGRTLAGRYTLLARIGRGGMGDVYRAHDRELDELIALKVVRDDLMRVAEVMERFRAEVKLARRVTHKNVARTYELGRDDRLTFFTMELVDGASLTERLAQGPMTPTAAVAIVAELCDALEAAHAVGVIHRDLKPDNVLLARDGRVVLTDFGVAALSTARDEPSSGTPRYMAPEQALGHPPTPLVDVYALGLVLYEMLVGAAAFAGGLGTVLDAKQSVEHVAMPLGVAAGAAIDGELARVVARATARDPAGRWPSAAALRRALAPWSPEAGGPAPLLGGRGDDPAGLPTVIVQPPRAPRDLAHLASGFHDELLHRLARRTHMRMLRRAHGTVGAGGATVAIELPGEGPADLLVSIGLGGRGETLTLRVPLAVEALIAGAELASRVVAAVVGAGPELVATESPCPPAALERLWRARVTMRLELTTLERALDEFRAALALAPGEPRIAAGLAMCEARIAFFSDEHRADMLAAAAEHAATAAIAAPTLAEAQLACGHVRLHQGDVTAAAVHFRAAIARAPYLAEAHEWLGRLLLEAGFLVDGAARLTDALEMEPGLEVPRWDLARALALDGRWDEHDAMMEALYAVVGTRRGRYGARLRYAIWRGRHDDVAALRDELRTYAGGLRFEQSVLLLACDVVLGGPWAPVRERVLARVGDPNVAGPRRRAFVAQLSAEIAGFCGDVETTLVLLGDAVEHGLFDRHWLIKCPTLACVRATPRYAALVAIVEQRALGILDALYGDEGTRGTADTLLS